MTAPWVVAALGYVVAVCGVSYGLRADTRRRRQTAALHQQLTLLRERLETYRDDADRELHEPDTSSGTGRT